MIAPSTVEQLIDETPGLDEPSTRTDAGQLSTTERIVAEDAKPGAGHMQVNLPAPWSGFFEPAVNLGQSVIAGQLFGTVVDTLGANRAPVLVPHNGIVIVLHSFARVDANESLGVVLDASTITPANRPTTS